MTPAVSMEAVPAAAQGLPPDAVDHVAVARLYGELLFALPQDLYIPPDALEVFLEAFEGPLDLLLYLIRKQNVDILDIPMADVTRQYLAYVEQIRRTHLELASDYLLMAAMLIEIKSRLLLPVKKVAEGAEASDPRAELVRRLVEYEQMKLAAQRLDALPLLGRDFLVPQVLPADDAQRAQRAQRALPSVELRELHDAWQAVLQRSRLLRRHSITRETLTVADVMGRVLRALQSRTFVEFRGLFAGARGRGEEGDSRAPGSGVGLAASAQALVVTFSALLELAREQIVDITQAEAYAPIYLRLLPQRAA